MQVKAFKCSMHLMVWKSCLKQDMMTLERLERVQRRDIQMTLGCIWATCTTKGCKGCAITTLYRTRSRGDLIKAYRIISGNEASGKGFFELAPNNAARGHRCEFFNKRKGTYESSVLASIHMNLTYDGTASVDNIAVFKRTLRETFY